jgi:hypothetical protein
MCCQRSTVDPPNDAQLALESLARAKLQSRIKVSATSSTLNPPKKRISNTLLFRSLYFARRCKVIYSTFNAFADRHPWVGEEDIRPKSIAREMFEGFRSFADYVSEYDLERAEGLLLRHLNSVYKVLSQTVPDVAKTDEIREMELYFGDMLGWLDSS